MATLPVSLVAEILRRLPEKSILRFRSVSKEWASFCSEPYFAKLRRQNLDCKLIQSHGRLYSLDLDSLDCALEVDDLLQGSGFGLDKVLGCSNGLLCLSVYVSHTGLPEKRYGVLVENIPPADPNDEIVVICDLSTGARRVVPPSPVEGLEDIPTRRVEVTAGSTMLSKPGSKRTADCKRRFEMLPKLMRRHFSYGFGFDPSSEDYKLVRISQYVICDPYCGEVLLHEVKVYSMKTNSWSRVDHDVAHICINPMAEPALADGVLYWTAGYWTTKTHVQRLQYYREIVVAFDLADESFLDIVYEEEGSYVLCLGSMGGKLCVMTRCPENVKLWKIEENGDVWILLGSFSFTVLLLYPVCPTMHFSKNGDKVLVAQHKSHDKICFDLAKETWSRFGMKFISMQEMVEFGKVSLGPARASRSKFSLLKWLSALCSGRG